MPDCVDNGSKVSDDPRITRTSQYVWWQSSAFLLGFIWYLTKSTILRLFCFEQLEHFELWSWKEASCPTTSCHISPNTSLSTVNSGFVPQSHPPLFYFLKPYCCISSKPVVVFVSLAALFLCNSLRFCSTSSLFSVDMSTVLVFSFSQKSNPKVNFAGLFSINAMQCNGLPMNPSIQTLVADGGLKSESTGPLFISDNSKKHCQRHNGPEGWVLLTKLTSLGHITSSNTNLDQTSSESRPCINFKISTKHHHFDKT